MADSTEQILADIIDQGNDLYGVMHDALSSDSDDLAEIYMAMASRLLSEAALAIGRTPIPEIALLKGKTYSDEEWSSLVESITATEACWNTARSVHSGLSALTSAIQANFAELRRLRAIMIKTDPRNPTELGELSGIGRSRCSQILWSTAWNLDGIPGVDEA